MIRSFFYFTVLSCAFLVSACTPRIAGGYEVKNDVVIYHSGMKGLGTTSSKPVDGADPESFEIISRYFGRDKNRAYYLGTALKNTHGPTFELIEGPYQKDKNRVFYNGKEISSSPSKFKILFKLKKSAGPDAFFATDGNVIFKGSAPFLPDLVDAATFERIGKVNYFKDKNRVYTIVSEIEGADPETFDVNARFKGTYSSDKSRLYYEGKPVEGLDLDSHRIIDRFHHADKKSVYFRRDVLSDDPENFKILNEAYSRDSKSAFWRSRKISDDGAGFTAFPSKRGAAYGKDEENAFWGWKVISGADVESFVGLNHNYAKDKNNVYFGVNTVNPPRIIKDADPASFALVKGEKGIDARDKDGPFNFGRRRKNRK